MQVMKKINYRKIKQCVAILLILLMSFSLVSCSTVGASFKNFKDKFFPEEKPDTIKIAIYEPITGEFSTQGKIEVNGIELAHDTKPQVLGKDIELVYLDNKSDMYEGEEILNNMLTTEFSGVIGSYGDVLTLVCGKKVKELKIPGIATSSINNLLTLNNPYYFTTSYSEDNQGRELARYAHDELGVKHISIVKILKDETQDSVIESFKETLADLGDTKVTEYTVTIDQETYRNEIADIKKSGSDSILLLLPIKSAKVFMGECKEIAYYPEFLGTRIFNDPEMVKHIEDGQYNCSYATDIMSSDDNLGTAFSKAYRDKYGVEPESTAAAIAYDAYMILVNAIEVSNKEYGNISGEAIKGAISSLKDYNGVSGYTTYEGSNVASKPIDIKRYVGFKIVKNDTKDEENIDSANKTEGEK